MGCLGTVFHQVRMPDMSAQCGKVEITVFRENEDDITGYLIVWTQIGVDPWIASQAGASAWVSQHYPESEHKIHDVFSG